MNYYPKKLWVFYLVMVGISLTLACGDDDSSGPTLLEERLEALAGNWVLGTVNNDGQDVTGQFSGFTLTLTSSESFTTTNGGNAWPASGTFQLSSTNLNELTRDDGVRVTITTINETNLSLTFQITEVGGTAAGSNGITGTFIFNLNKTS